MDTPRKYYHLFIACIYLILFVPAAVSQAVVESYKNWGWVSCLGDDKISVVSSTLVVNSNNNTVESCLDTCTGAICGIKNGTECYQISSISYFNGQSANPCNVPCPGNPSEICGGSSAMDLYELGYYTINDSLAVIENYGSWGLLGCYSNDKPASSNFVIIDSDNNTVQSCLDSCSARGFSLGGVQNGRECYCSDSITYDGPNYYACHMTCSGNPLEICGGYNAINLYENGHVSNAPVVGGYDGSVWLGCWEDSAPRTLHHGIGGSDNNTVVGCVETCAAQGFSLAGVEYGRECYCGNSILYNYGQSAACTMPCSGNSLETCGGPDAIDIYNIAGSDYTVGPASELQSYNGWSVTTCWDDNIWPSGGPRLLPHWPKVSIPAEQMTVEKCIDGCASSGYTSAGLEWGQECWCGNVTYPPGESTPGACNMPCLGNAREYCGDSNFALLYTNIY